MQYYSARKLKETGLWHYTVGSHPVGYCADDCPGHATEEEACEHYKQYLLDKRMRPGTLSNQMLRCRECKEFTDGVVHIGAYQMFILCPAHQGKETVAKHLRIGESWES